MNFFFAIQSRLQRLFFWIFLCLLPAKSPRFATRTARSKKNVCPSKKIFQMFRFFFVARTFFLKPSFFFCFFFWHFYITIFHAIFSALRLSKKRKKKDKMFRQPQATPARYQVSFFSCQFCFFVELFC